MQSATGQVLFGPCVHVELGVASGRGFGLDQPSESDAFWGAALGGLTARLVASPLTAWLSLEAGTPFARPVYVIDGFGTVFRSDAVLLRASSGVAFTFP